MGWYLLAVAGLGCLAYRASRSGKWALNISHGIMWLALVWSAVVVAVFAKKGLLPEYIWSCIGVCVVIPGMFVAFMKMLVHLLRPITPLHSSPPEGPAPGPER